MDGDLSRFGRLRSTGEGEQQAASDRHAEQLRHCVGVLPNSTSGEWHWSDANRGEAFEEVKKLKNRQQTRGFRQRSWGQSARI